MMKNTRYAIAALAALAALAAFAQGPGPTFRRGSLLGRGNGTNTDRGSGLSRFGAGTRTAGGQGGGMPGMPGMAGLQGMAGLSEASSDDDKPSVGTNGVPYLAFNQSPVDMVLDAYAEQLGKTILPAPDIPKPTITLNSEKSTLLTKEEYLEAIEVVLSMNGIVLEPFGEKFVKALPRKTARVHGLPMITKVGDKLHPEKTRVISQLIQFQYITVAEGQKALEGFKDPSGLFQVFERTNAILVTDIQENVNRMLEIVKLIDIESPVVEDVFVRQIEYAVANDIKTLLEEIVTASQEEKRADAVGTNRSGSPGFSRTNTTTTQPRLLNLNNRPGGNQQPNGENFSNPTVTAAISDADRGMIRGKVLIKADERSNKLIVITSPANMKFFDKVIKTLDVATTPEVEIQVIRLKYAVAEDVEQMLNDLIGASSGSANTRNGQNNQNRPQGGNQNGNLTRNTLNQRTATSNPSFRNTESSRLGELNKDNVKILADERINGIVVMARKSDMKAVKDVIERMDVKLSQVLIETVIVQVELGDDLQTGIDWVQRGRSRQTVQETDASGNKRFRLSDESGQLSSISMSASELAAAKAENSAYDGYSLSAVPSMVTKLVRDGFYNNGNYMLGGGGGSGTSALQHLFVGVATNAADIVVNPIGGGINYFLKSDKLNLGAVLQAAKSDSHTKVLASPILMTVDNKEATIEAKDMIYLFSGYQYSGSSMYGSQVRNYEKRDIGLEVKATPRINPNGTVVLEIEATFETQGADQNVPNESGGTDPYATVTTRKIKSDVSVDNRQTIVMGGLTKTAKTKSESGIPILKDIPWIGRWLFSSVNETERRSELLVFMTPYVLDDAEVAQVEAMRRKKALSDPRPWEDNGWSASPLADPISQKEQLRRFNDEWKRQDEERKTKLAIEKAKIDRAKKLKQMSEQEREFWFKMHEKELREEAEEHKKKTEEEQAELRELVEEFKRDKIGEADKAIEDSKQIEKNEHDRLADEAAAATDDAPAASTPVVPAPADPDDPVPVPVVPAPAAPAPEVQAPAVSAPEVPAPVVPAPEVQAPAVPAPEVQAPAVAAPAVQAPAVQAPVVPAPEVQAPAVPAPEVQAPAVPAPAETVPVVPAVEPAPVVPVVPSEPDAE